jgi:hypothetical protein
MLADMKHFAMTRRKEPAPPPPETPRKRKPEAAFDLWLKRGLHKLYDDVTNEPIPPDLLKLIEEDRKKQ